MIIGYLGPEGTYCEQATDLFLESDSNAKKYALPPNIPEMFL